MARKFSAPIASIVESPIADSIELLNDYPIPELEHVPRVDTEFSNSLRNGRDRHEMAFNSLCVSLRPFHNHSRAEFAFVIVSSVVKVDETMKSVSAGCSRFAKSFHDVRAVDVGNCTLKMIDWVA